MTAPIAIVGAGIVSPIGTGLAAFGEACAAGTVGIGPAPYHGEPGAEHAWAARVTDFDPDRWMEPRVRDATARFSQFALAAAVQAVESAGGIDPDRTGCVHGTAMAGIDALAAAQHALSTVGPQAVPRKLNIEAWPNMAGGQIALRFGLHGPLSTISTACASSADAIGLACWMIEQGRADAMLAGGSDAALQRLTFHSQINYGMLRPVEDPRRASLPFDVARCGIVEGEGSAMIVLEDGERARVRGAQVLGWVRGYASVSEAYHPSSPQPDGHWEQRVMRLALADAGIEPDEVDVVLAHGTATPVGDAAEIAAINAVFGGRPDLVVTSVKGHVGHSGGAANVTALLAGLWGMANDAVVPTAGTTELDPAVTFRVPLGTQPLRMPVRTMVVNAFGFGGQDSCLVVTAEP